MSRVGKEAEDVTRATENVNALKTQSARSRSRDAGRRRGRYADWDLANEPFDRVLVKPKRGGVSVQLIALVWVPA